jgi:hypothetical protein
LTSEKKIKEAIIGQNMETNHQCELSVDVILDVNLTDLLFYLKIFCKEILHRGEDTSVGYVKAGQQRTEIDIVKTHGINI